MPPDLDRRSRCAKFLPEGYEIRTVDLIPVQYDLHFPLDHAKAEPAVRFKSYEECVIAALSHKLENCASTARDEVWAVAMTLGRGKPPKIELFGPGMDIDDFLSGSCTSGRSAR